MVSRTSVSFAEARRLEIRGSPIASTVRRSFSYDEPALPSPPPPPPATSVRQPQQRASELVLGSDGSDSDGEHFERRLNRYNSTEGGVLSVRPTLTTLHRVWREVPYEAARVLRVHCEGRS